MNEQIVFNAYNYGLSDSPSQMAELLTLDQIEKKYGEEARDKAAKAQAEMWANEWLQKNKPEIDKEHDRMFEEMLIYGRTYFKYTEIDE